MVSFAFRANRWICRIRRSPTTRSAAHISPSSDEQAGCPS
jgi:hypothetical protein